MAPNAVASPTADLASIGRDYAGDQKITPCRFAKEQLKAARHEITPDIETYATGLRDAVTRAIRRWTNGDCRGKRGGARLSIVVVRPRGEAGEESVTIKNLTRRAVNLRNYALRDSTDHTLRLRATRLKAGRTLRVVTGCRSGHRGVCGAARATTRAAPSRSGTTPATSSSCSGRAAGCSRASSIRLPV